ncbi:helix-turn-helix domain-containing protein [Brevibacillus sp. NRS-1366]|uniref:helix-turn-helix domain-containing protein n=1 Tax=Brevibacillus sp. NRS-1366 TaxID=3233899 RepID=UPI003D24113E
MLQLTVNDSNKITLRQAREKLGLSEQEVSEKTGIPVHLIKCWEFDNREALFDLIFDLIRFYGVTFSQVYIGPESDLLTNSEATVGSNQENKPSGEIRGKRIMDIHMLRHLTGIKNDLVEVTCRLVCDDVYTREMAVRELQKIVSEVHHVEEIYINQTEEEADAKNYVVGQ